MFCMCDRCAICVLSAVLKYEVLFSLESYKLVSVFKYTEETFLLCEFAARPLVSKN